MNDSVLEQMLSLAEEVKCSISHLQSTSYMQSTVLVQ